MTQTAAETTALTTTAADSPLSSRERGAGGERSFPRYPAYRDSSVPWLGAIPAHWEVKRLKFVARMAYGDSLSADEREPGDVPVYGSNGIVGEHSKPNTLGPCLIVGRKGSHGKVAFSEAPCFAIDTTYFIDCSHTDCDLRWLFYALPCLRLDEVSQDTGVPGLSREMAYDERLPVPPLAEQRAIAAFLDRETAHIEALVEAKRRLIELLREKRAALISRAVTRGLDASVPLRESGIPAVGDIPVHWRVKRNKAIFREAGERSVDGQEELLTVSHITGVTRRSEKDVTMFMAESFEGYKLCRPGDLAVNTMWAWMGAVGIARELGIVSPSYNVYRLRAEVADEYDPEYLDLLYRTPAYVCEINRYSQGIWDSRLRLYPDAFFSMQTLTPPIDEQRQIVEHCRFEIAYLDAFGQKLSESIERLREYRMALIAAAVTGAIDVRGQVARDGAESADGARESAG